ncbi:hypothetical protein LQU94_01055 [Peptoniphilus sp. KCTC 25270]|uniref:hypothetical protein n=1 Tax=Peptoniphilus sp. KCTC 25270 TaxID=2897414 RepID=UPI001E343386|nr:hypothetical protein [Peptoniphilus sp. KCTC 25270]MCD1146703.1 hypothetical protein [Peptoniphilus sp. KCTC 25270]
MNITITLHDLLRILLYLAGIGALVYLALVLKNVVGILKSLRTKLDEHEAVIDDTFKKLPTITDNVTVISTNASRLTTDATEMVEVVKPEVERIAVTVGGVTDTVDDIARSVDETTLRLTSTAAVVSDSINDTARTISFNANNIVDYFYILREVLEALRDVIRTR